MRSFPAIRKDAGLFCGSFLRKSEVFAYGGRIQNLRNLKDTTPRRGCRDFPRKGQATGYGGIGSSLQVLKGPTERRVSQAYLHLPIHTVEFEGFVASHVYRGNRHPVGPYSRTMPRLLWRS